VQASAPAAQPYAKALFELARERQLFDDVGRELDALAAEAAGGELNAFFERPWIAPAAKRAVAAQVAERLGVSRLMRDFLALVAAQGRANVLADIAAAYHAMVDAERGIVRARVRTAVALTDDERQTLAARLARALERENATGAAAAGSADGGRGRISQVVIDEVVDPTLMGGFVAEIGSLILDGSLDGQLARLRQRLSRG
jgi:F-type H+-transporting ATPase subunit delta